MDLEIIPTMMELPEAVCSNPPLPHILNLPSEILGVILNNVLAVPFANRPPWGSWVELTSSSTPDVEFTGVNPNYTLSGSRTHITPREWLQPLLTCRSFYFIGREAFYAINPIIFCQGGTVAQLYNVSPERCGFLRSLNLEPGDSDPAVVFSALSKYHNLQHLRISFHEDNEQDQKWLRNCAEPLAQLALQQLPKQLRELEFLVLRNNDYSNWMFPRQLDEAGWSDDLIEIAEHMTMAITGRSMLYPGLTIVYWPLIESQQSEDSDVENGEARCATCHRPF
ncbi:MAG: hypothetical protein Q9214_001326 [Letrouitia sp. 1 TL-2023]